MKTFLKTLGLATLFAVAISPARVFAQDENAPPIPYPDQGQIPGNMNMTPALAPYQPQAPNQSPPQGQAANSITFQDFYNQLSRYGSWFQTDNYGYVWQPTERDPNWRPYTYGHWVNSNAGMMWDSDEPFGWATYHYGRWVNLAGHGWVWVPGYTWAPAWVSWRTGNDIGNASNASDTSDTSDYGDYCGWAPLPPDTFLGIDFFDPGLFGWLGFGDWYWLWPGYWWGCNIGNNCDLAYGIGPGCYNFCPAANLGDPNPWTHFADRRNNFALINHTHNVTDLNVSNGRVVGQFGRVHSDGPGSAALARSHTPIENVRLTSASSLAGNDHGSSGSLAVFAPNVRANSDAHPSRVSANLGNVAVNRGADINQPLAVNSHLRGAAPTSAQIRAATLAGRNASAGAMVARANTTFSRTLSRPLSSYHPGSMAGTNFRPTTTATAATSPASTFHASNASSSSRGESAFTGEPVVHHTSTASQGSSSFGGFSHRSSSSGSSEARPSAYHSSPSPSYHSSVTSSYRSSMVHSSSFAYHPQSSFHFSAPSAHYGGGAPSYHFSGGGGGHFSGGGRPSGGGHSGGGNQQHH